MRKGYPQPDRVRTAGKSALKASKKNLEIRRGDSFRFAFRVWTMVNGVKTYTDLTGYTGKAQMRANELAADVLLEFAVTVDLALPGLVRVYAAPAATNTLPQDGGLYDIQLTSPGGDVDTFLEGAIKVTTGVTRP